MSLAENMRRTAELTNPQVSPEAADSHVTPTSTRNRTYAVQASPVTPEMTFSVTQPATSGNQTYTVQTASPETPRNAVDYAIPAAANEPLLQRRRAPVADRFHQVNENIFIYMDPEIGDGGSPGSFEQRNNRTPRRRQTMPPGNFNMVFAQHTGRLAVDAPMDREQIETLNNDLRSIERTTGATLLSRNLRVRMRPRAVVPGNYQLFKNIRL